MFNILSSSLFTAARMTPPRHPLNPSYRDQARDDANRLAFTFDVRRAK